MSITVTDYSYRQLITGDSPANTNSGQILRINEDSVDATFFDNVQNGGGDIRVCSDEDGLNQLPLYVLVCDTSTDALELRTLKGSYTTLNRDVYIFCGTGTTDS